MYDFLLSFHSIFRYVIILLSLIVIVQSIIGVTQKSNYTSSDEKVGLFYMISWDIMFLVGLLLYAVFSPLTQAAFQDFGAAMKDPNLRYFAMEHTLMMFISLVLVHIGRSKVKKAGLAYQKHKLSLIFYGLATAIALFAIPWALRGYWPA